MRKGKLKKLQFWDFGQANSSILDSQKFSRNVVEKKKCIFDMDSENILIKSV